LTDEKTIFKTKGKIMEGMTTGDKLLAQDDIDALLGQAGLEGSYNSDKKVEAPPKLPVNNSALRFSNVTEDEVHDTISILLSKALLDRTDDLKIIWNAMGTIPMATGFNMVIENMEYESLGVLKEHHLVVKQKPVE
jgi:hypothetical protein